MIIFQNSNSLSYRCTVTNYLKYLTISSYQTVLFRFVHIRFRNTFECSSSKNKYKYSVKVLMAADIQINRTQSVKCSTETKLFFVSLQML